MDNQVTVYQGKQAREIKKEIYWKQYKHNQYKDPEKAQKHLKKYKQLEAVK